MTTANTRGAGKAAATKPPSTKAAAPTVARALAIAQDIVRYCHAAGIPVDVKVFGSCSAIVLAGVYYCYSCRTFSQGSSCQKCAHDPVTVMPEVLEGA